MLGGLCTQGSSGSGNRVELKMLSERFVGELQVLDSSKSEGCDAGATAFGK